MPIQRRTDGFSADGLRYSVASDFDKQIGQALAEQEARMRDPRFVPGARVESPDSPDLLRQELIDPVLTAFGVNTERIASNRNPARALADRPYKIGEDWFSFDPIEKQMNRIQVQGGSEAKPVAATIPDTESETRNWFANNKTMQAEEAQALDKLAQEGADAFDILGTQHPMLLKAAPYATRFGPIYRSAATRRERLKNAPVESVTPNIGNLSSERARLEGQINQGGLPTGTSQAYSNRIADIDASIAPTPPESDELVPVINPRGKAVKIKASELERALRMGYRQR